ncbi:MAG TPA: glutamine--fructose-6-phosphate transaminase (isomerizing) [Gemmatimonadaceae bacterium]|nr:glutamine--fructose-6-phosphate transaminase (isomerizing) [Gemmatimonadaceae bacterium]
MCGIVGYVGRRDASSVLLDGLERLEYRGYDSAGIAVHNCASLQVRKQAGRIQVLRALVETEPAPGSCGIGHTRWATHGVPSALNAHPHTDCRNTVAVVHNGIIENADELRHELEAQGHAFRTDTDSEVIAHLIESAEGATLEERTQSALTRVTGSYGVAVIGLGETGKIVAARRGTPLLIGVGNGEIFIASDASAVQHFTRRVVHLGDGDLATVTDAGYRITDPRGQECIRPPIEVSWRNRGPDRGIHPHYMRKEIAEQPETIRAVLADRLHREDGTAWLDGLNLGADDIAAIRRIVIVACGSSWHAGLVGRHYMEEIAGIPVEVEYASEYRYRHSPRVSGTLTIAISQSGETADTLEALREARAAGSHVLGIVNVENSSIARETDGGMYLHAGPEIGVASTKAFTAQLVALMLMALHFGRHRGLPKVVGRAIVAQMLGLPQLVSRVLELDAEVRAIAEVYAPSQHALYLGRGQHFPVALEGALKLKEISYIHAEGYPAAEMKHGPIALIDANMPVIFVAPRDEGYAKVLSNMKEVNARGGQIIALTTEGNSELRNNKLAAHQLHVPDCPPLMMPIVASVPLQLLAYHIAVLRGCNVDQPRNLAKSVTVE